MTNSESPTVVAIMFSDFKGSSRITDSSQKKRLYRIHEEIARKALGETSDNPIHFFQKSTGDGYFICSDSPAQLAEAALTIRDDIQTTDWRSLGFAHDLDIRIGLHTGEVEILYYSHNSEKIQDVVGTAVDAAARIESVADPGAVFCSSAYYECLNSDSTHNIRGYSLGKRRLPRGFGEMVLYELYRYSEPMGTTPPIAGRFVIGDLISHNESLRISVHKGYDLRRPGRIVAIKYLDLHRLDDLEPTKRFRREVDALRQLENERHDNIVEFTIVQENIALYIVMDYIPDTLDRLTKSKLSPADVMDIGMQLAHALAFAHRKGVIHRDIKPSNVLLTVEKTPKLTDFGLAHLVGRPRITQYGSVAGTVAYMPPEMLIPSLWGWRRSATPDKKTDIWSFGVMMYELLAGREPFTGNTDEETMDTIARKDPRPLSEIRSDVPGDLVGLVQRMLHRNRRKRPASFDEVCRELKRIKEAKPPSSTTIRIFGREIEVWKFWFGVVVWPLIVAVIAVILQQAFGDLSNRNTAAATATAQVVIADVADTLTIQAAQTQTVVTTTNLLTNTLTAMDTPTLTPTPISNNTPISSHTPTDTPTRPWTPSETVDAAGTETALAEASATAYSGTATQLAMQIALADTQIAVALLPTPTFTPTTDVCYWNVSTKEVHAFDTVVSIPIKTVTNCRVIDGTRFEFEGEPFQISLRPITNWQFKQCRRQGGCNRPSNPSGPSGDSLPVVGVTWYQADFYCKSLGGRLPTSEEWEFAALGIEEMQGELREWTASDDALLGTKIVLSWENSGPIRSQQAANDPQPDIGFRCVFSSPL